MAVANGPGSITNGLVSYYDPGNQKSYSPNVVQSSTDLLASVGSYGVSNGTIVRDTIISPVGSTPIRMISSAGDQYTNSYAFAGANLAPALNGQAWTISYYAKTTSPSTNSELVLFAANSIGGLTTGSQASSLGLTPTWERYTFTGTLTDATTAFVQTRFDQNVSGATVWYDGLQIERGSAATAFNPNYYGNNILRNLVSTSNATLFNDITFGGESSGKLVGNTASGYITFEDGLGDAFTAFSIEFVARTKTGTGTDLTSYVIHRGVGQTVGGSVYAIFTNGDGNLVFSVNTTSQITVTGINNVLAHYVLTWSGNAISVYRNGVFFGTLAFSTFTNTRSGTTKSLLGTSVVPAYRPGANELFMVKTYNRELLATEVKSNFDSVRGRFGL